MYVYIPVVYRFLVIGELIFHFEVDSGLVCGRNRDDFTSPARAPKSYAISIFPDIFILGESQSDDDGESDVRICGSSSASHIYSGVLTIRILAVKQ